MDFGQHAPRFPPTVGARKRRGWRLRLTRHMEYSTFVNIAEENAGFVYNVAYRMMGNPHDAEEVAQDAFVSAFKARDRFRGESQATTWLYRITVNAALMRLRRDKRRREMTVTEDARPDSPSTDLAEMPGPAALNSELGKKLVAAVDDLPDDLRTAVVLRDIQGLSNSEAADILGVSIPALKARLHRGRVVIRGKLSEYVQQTSA